MRLLLQSTFGRIAYRSILLFWTDAQYVSVRNEVVNRSIEEVIQYLEGDGQIAILDGSNLTRKRREQICESIRCHVVVSAFLHCSLLSTRPSGLKCA